MKVIFHTQNDKDLALQTARRSPLELCGELYIHMLEESSIEGEPEKKVVEEDGAVVEILEDVEQIKII